MSADRPDATDPFARQLAAYWEAWGKAFNDSLGQAASPPFGGGGAQAGGPWLHAIHQLAREALEQGLDSAGMAAAWRRILKCSGLWPTWPTVDVSQMHAAQAVWEPLLSTPAFGPAREYIERWQELSRLQVDSWAEGGPLRGLLDAMMERAITYFEQQLREHDHGGSIDSARALFDLWIEAAEKAWQEMAGEEAFARHSAEATHAQLRFQQASQAEWERFCRASGMPTRSEMDQAQQRIVQLERQVAALMARQGDTDASPERRPQGKTGGKKTAAGKSGSQNVKKTARTPPGTGQKRTRKVSPA